MDKTIQEPSARDPLRITRKQNRPLPFDVRSAGSGLPSDSDALATYMLGKKDLSGSSFPDSGFTGGWHGTSHHGDKPDNVANYAKVNRYHVQNLAYFADELAKLQEGEGTLLDHILIYKGSNMGNSHRHAHVKVPIVLLGGVDGKFKGNRHLVFPGQHRADVEHAARRIAQIRYLRHSVLRRGGPERGRSPASAPAQSRCRYRSRDANRLLLPAILLVSQVLVQGAVSEVADAASRGDKAAVRALILRKADVNVAQSDGTTALHWAAEADDLETADLLIRAGAKVMAASRAGAAPLLLASTNGSAAMIEKLAKAGADVNASLTLSGDTALMMASRTGKIDAIKVLLDGGAKVNTKETWGGTTALMWAVSERHPAVVKMLIDHGADVNAKSFLHRLRPRLRRNDARRRPTRQPEEFASGC